MTPTDCNLSGSSVHGVSQAGILGWVASSSSRGSSWRRDPTLVPRIGRWILYHWAIREAHGGTSKKVEPKPPNDALGPPLNWMLETVCCDPLWSPLQYSLVQQVEQNQDKVWLLRIHGFVSIPATFTLVLPLPVSFQNNMIALQVSSLIPPLHLITFLLGSWPWFLPLSSCSGHGDDNLIFPASLLALPQDPSLDLPTGPAPFCHCRMDPLSQ